MAYLEEIAVKGRDANPFFKMMGIQIVSYGEGKAELSMEIRPDMLNGDGWLQGGVFAALSDEAMALALHTVLDEGEGIATISENTTFMRGTREGTLISSAEVIRKGRRIAFARGTTELAGDGGKTLSMSDASFAVLKKHP